MGLSFVQIRAQIGHQEYIPPIWKAGFSTPCKARERCPCCPDHQSHATSLMSLHADPGGMAHCWTKRRSSTNLPSGTRNHIPSLLSTSHNRQQTQTPKGELLQARYSQSSSSSNNNDDDHNHNKRRTTNNNCAVTCFCHHPHHVLVHFPDGFFRDDITETETLEANETGYKKASKSIQTAT